MDQNFTFMQHFSFIPTVNIHSKMCQPFTFITTFHSDANSLLSYQQHTFIPTFYFHTNSSLWYQHFTSLQHFTFIPTHFIWLVYSICFTLFNVSLALYDLYLVVAPQNTQKTIPSYACEIAVQNIYITAGMSLLNIDLVW